MSVLLTILVSLSDVRLNKKKGNWNTLLHQWKCSSLLIFYVYNSIISYFYYWKKLPIQLSFLPREVFLYWNFYRICNYFYMKLKKKKLLKGSGWFYFKIITKRVLGLSNLKHKFFFNFRKPILFHIPLFIWFHLFFTNSGIFFKINMMV